MFNGGDPSGEVAKLEWSHWGDATATGRGVTWLLRPEGGYYARPGRIVLRAEAHERQRQAHLEVVAEAVAAGSHHQDVHRVAQRREEGDGGGEGHAHHHRPRVRARALRRLDGDRRDHRRHGGAVHRLGEQDGEPHEASQQQPRPPGSQQKEKLVGEQRRGARLHHRGAQRQHSRHQHDALEVHGGQIREHLLVHQVPKVDPAAALHVDAHTGGRRRGAHQGRLELLRGDRG